ncbi:MAG: hypothetical protein NTY47_02860, partial [Candidatus Omnitrophica bacterium]|nr:hypothetical protein [Candidatus Omnitrophota bacterium]
LTRKSPYMLFTAKVKQDKLLQAANLSANGLDSLKNIRSVIPAVTHVDNSARIQTVNSNDNKIYYGLLKSFYNLTGCPVIINTSFNVRGEPIVCTPEEAFNCFIRTDMDFLILGKFILDKKEQTATKNGISAVTFQELD